MEEIKRSLRGPSLRVHHGHLCLHKSQPRSLQRDVVPPGVESDSLYNGKSLSELRELIRHMDRLLARVYTSLFISEDIYY